MSRKPPEHVDPVVIDGVRYEQVMNATRYGFDEAPGYLRAVREADGVQLWIKQIYALDIDPERERDVQEVYFRSMSVGEDGMILIENERGRKFSVDPATGESTPVG